MAWFADLAGRAENLLNSLDEQTGAALRNHNVTKKKWEKNEFTVAQQTESTWGQRKRLPPRTLKKINTENKSSIPSRKSSPLSNHQSRSPSRDNQDVKNLKPKKSASRKSSPQYTMNQCPNTLVADHKDKPRTIKQRRLSLPADLEVYSGDDDLMYQMQNMEVENAMLRNELNVMNREVSELATKLRMTQDDAAKTQIKLETADLMYQKINTEKEALSAQVEQLKLKLTENTNTEVTKQKELNKGLQEEIELLRIKTADSDEKCTELRHKLNEKEIAQIKLENDLRHAQSTISNLQSNLEKSNEECRRLERDWEAYKVRVKNMLLSKDNVIKSLQEGMEVTVDTKELMHQIQALKEERDELSEVTTAMRNECEDLKSYMGQVEARHTAAERVVCALRDALREERTARNRADAQWASVTKDLKSLQIETGQTIASLRMALRDKDNELHRLRDTSSTVRSTDTSALNVADYDIKQDTIDSNKIEYLTQALVLRQSKIDKLLADNNILKIQLEKLETKYKKEISAVRSNSSHSVVHLQDECRHRSRSNMTTDTLSALSVRLGVMVKRYPVLRVFVIAYMVCLHFWVLTVLCTSTPEFASRPSKS
ncbi:unnamed protein product [Arctia plantaginis]|uniref:Golgin-84 n=1 Tax=Arctia plantaginis TaxID=874455 RepID=A0A8S0ZUC8_ARCPL|nr:unnamed protein product [Arctia plantaginis]